MEKITSFTQLRSWQNAKTLAVNVYEITKKFPQEELYGLVSQMRRAGVSVAANIAEGFSRNTAKDKINFYRMSLGSLTETMSHAYIAHDLGYINETTLNKLLLESADLQKMLYGLMKTAEGKKS